MVGLSFLGASGCATPARRGALSVDREAAPESVRGTESHRPALRPVITVEAFDNRSGFTGSWPLGEGLAEQLMHRLVESDQVDVVRGRTPEEGRIMVLARQARNLFQAGDREESGPPLQARYAVQGAVTEFAVRDDDSGWFPAPEPGFLRRRPAARVSLRLVLFDLETGHVARSVNAEGRSGGRTAVDYRSIPFGGDAFFRTPLGRAAEQALDHAVRELLAEIPVSYWYPRVAEGGVETVVINGGYNVGLQEGMEFIVRAKGRRITDPATGEPIDTRPGPVKGRIRVLEIRPTASTAHVIEGEAKRGDPLEPMR